MADQSHSTSIPSTPVCSQPIRRPRESRDAQNKVVDHRVSHIIDKSDGLANSAEPVSNARKHNQLEGDPDQEDHIDLWTSFGLTPQHPLRKAVSTTFKAVTDTFKSQAPFLYADDPTENQRPRTGTPSITSPDHKLRKFHHRMSNSISRSKTRFISSLKNRYLEEGNYENRDLIHEGLDTRNDLGTEDADDDFNHSPIDVEIPSPTFSNISLEFPWIHATNKGLKTAHVTRELAQSAENPSDNSFSRTQCRVTNNPSCSSPTREFFPSLALLNGGENKNKTWNGRLLRIWQRSQANAPESGPTKQINSTFQSSLDENATAVKVHECDFQEAPVVGSLADWKQKMDDRNKRYQEVSSLTPARSSVRLEASLNIAFQQESARATPGDTDGTIQDKCFSGEDQSVKTPSGFLKPQPANSTNCMRHALDAIDRRTRDESCESDKVRVIDLDHEATNAQSFRKGMQNIDEVLNDCDSKKSLYARVVNQRPGLDRQFSARSAESVESCAVTSKSQLLICNNETSIDHHRRGSDSKDQRAKEGIRQSLESINSGDRDFIVERSPEQGALHDNSLKSTTTSSFKGYKNVDCDVLGPVRTTKENFSRSSSNSYQDLGTTRKGLATAHLPLEPVTPTFNASHARVSSKGADSYASSEKASKQYRNSTPCSIWLTQSLIPAPTYISPAASRRNLITLTPPHRRQQNTFYGVLRDTSHFNSTEHDGFIAARLPLFSKPDDSSRNSQMEELKEMELRGMPTPETPPSKPRSQFRTAPDSVAEATSPYSDISRAANPSESIHSLLMGSESDNEEWSGSETVVNGVSVISSRSGTSYDPISPRNISDSYAGRRLALLLDLSADGENNSGASGQQEYRSTEIQPFIGGEPKHKPRGSLNSSPTRMDWSPIKSKRFE